MIGKVLYIIKMMGYEKEKKKLVWNINEKIRIRAFHIEMKKWWM